MNEHFLVNELPPSENLVSSDLPNIFTKKRHITYNVGMPAFSFDDTMQYFYFIIRGKIKISQVNPENSKEQTINILTRGDMYDVVTLLDGKEHEYVSSVLEESEVVEVPIEHIRELINTNPSFNSFFLPYLGKQMRQMEDLAVDLSLYDVYNRIIRLIARNVEDLKSVSRLKLINNLSHEEIASLIGSVRKVVNRNLQKLKDEGIIELSRKQIKLKSLQKLLEKLNY